MSGGKACGQRSRRSCPIGWLTQVPGALKRLAHPDGLMIVGGILGGRQGVLYQPVSAFSCLVWR